MSSDEKTPFGTRDKQGAMLVSGVEGKHSHQFQCRDSSPFENNLGDKLSKFSMNMKNYCSIHLRLLHNLNEDRRHDIFMLNPECHIKFLEGNLNFLSRKPPRCNDFKINSTKSSSYSVETLQKVYSLSENRLPALTFASLEGNAAQLNTIEKKLDNSNSRDTVIFDRSKIKVSNFPLQTCPSDKPLVATPPIIKIKEKYNVKKNQCNDSPSNLKLKPVDADKTFDCLKSKNDNDTQFEFTVAGEKIVSFVCSPPASRKLRLKQSESDGICESDEESTISSSKCSSETASNTSSKSSYTRLITKKEVLPMREHAIKTNMLLWHPPSASKKALSLSESKAIYSCSSFNRQIKQKSFENGINFFGSVNSVYALAGERSQKNPPNQETILFREAVLRGCYSIESLLKEVKTPLFEVEKEVTQTREAIFSAVRLQRDNDNVVPDCILSIVDICNSWIKLNAHFEQNDFKHLLELNGVDLSIIGEFAQWQCTSRTFVDKLIDVLKKLALCNDSKITNKQDSASMRGSEITKAHSNITKSGETMLNNSPSATTNINISQPITDIHSKRWKQRRFSSEKPDLEKVPQPSNRPFKSNFTVSSSFQNPLLANSWNTEASFGQGDNEFSFARDFSKVNHLLPLKNYQSAQGDMSLLLSGPKQLICSNSGFFDKNINICNMKCCNVKAETSICTAAPLNDLCASSTNLVDMPVNNYFPASLQQAVPTVPPLYNNQLCLLNANQYQPNFSHCIAKPNPIHCMDHDVGENLIQSSYMKPGHYTPPQKPTNFQKSVNNTVPIEDIPAVGIPFLYSASFTSPQQPKSLEFPNSLIQIQMSKDCNQNKVCDDTWKTALSLAGSLRDNMMADRTDDGPNLKISETVSLKSHFLLADDNSLNSDSDEQNFPSNNNPSKDIPVVKSTTKTTDWLIDSFTKSSPEDEYSLRSVNAHKDLLSENERAEISQSSEDSSIQEKKESFFLSNYLSDTYNNYINVNVDNISSKDEERLKPLLKNEAVYLQKKPRKNKKMQDDFTTFLDRKHPANYKSDSLVLTRAMSNRVMSQLEDILNCVWNTKVSTLIEEEIKSDKEMSKLELKVRSPLYLQAMRCKLRNHSYDTLDQALSDFQQYFTDIKNKNKGDRQCIEVIGALERIFFGLVEKHFGLTFRPLSQHISQISMSPTTKSRRTKKTPRRF